MLSFSEKSAYGMGAFGKDIAITTVYLFLMFYLTDVVGLNPAFVGTLFLITRLWDAFNDPMMGMIVDNTRTKWGKFKPWIAIGTITNSIILLLLFYQPSFISKDGMYIYITITYVLWGMTYTMIDIPFWSMVPVVATSQSDRAQIATILRFCASIPWMLVGTFGLSIISKLSGGSIQAIEQSQGFFLITVGLIFIFNLSILILLVKLKTNEKDNTHQEKITIKQAFTIISKNDQLLAFMGIVLLFNSMVQLVNGASLYFFTYVSGDKNLFSVFSGVGGIAELAGIFSYPIIAKYLDPKKSFALACTIPITGWLLLLYSSYFAPTNIPIVMFSSIFYKIGAGLFLAGSIVMLANIVDYSEKKFGTRNESIIFSIQTLLVKSASAFSGWIVGISLALSGYIANQVQTESVLMTIRMLMTVIPLVLGLLALYIDKKYFKLHSIQD